MAQIDQVFFFGQSASVEVHEPNGSDPGTPAEAEYNPPTQGASNTVGSAFPAAGIRLRAYPPGLGLSRIVNPA